MSSRSGRKNKTRKACTCFRVRIVRASQYGVSGEYGAQLWTKLEYRISRSTICVTYSARVSVGSRRTPWCNGRCGTAVQRLNATISLEWLTKFVRASNKPTKRRTKDRSYYVLTTVRPKRRKKLPRRP